MCRGTLSKRMPTSAISFATAPGPSRGTARLHGAVAWCGCVLRGGRRSCGVTNSITGAGADHAIREADALLYGLGDGGLLVPHDSGMLVHRDVVGPLAALAEAAAGASIQLQLCSGHRGFARQLAIWNDKAAGRRPILDTDGRPLEAAALAPDALIDAILRWSALPGGSRHHWGTDVDVYDAAAVPGDYCVQLTAEESATRFAALHRWLDVHMRDFGFYRPYATDLGGVAPEPWHLSYLPVAQPCYARLSVEGLAAAIRGSGMLHEARVLERLPELFARYVRRVAPP